MFLNLNSAELLAHRDGAVGTAFSIDQTKACAHVFSALPDRFFDDGAPPGLPMN